MQPSSTRHKLFTQLAGILLLLLTPGFAAQAGVFKCIDANGKTTYQATPCPDAGESEAIEIDEVKVEPAEPEAVPSDDDSAELEEEAEPVIDASAITGVWVEEKEDQKITLTISATGRYRWQVIFRGKNHSDLSGQWTLNGDKLTLKETYLGTNRYTVIKLAGKEMTTTMRSLGTEYTNHWRKLF